MYVDLKQLLGWKTNQSGNTDTVPLLNIYSVG